MKLTKASRYAIAFLFVLVILVIALGPLVAMREGFQTNTQPAPKKNRGEPCTRGTECKSDYCRGGKCK